jgi:hypothetical protein
MSLLPQRKKSAEEIAKLRESLGMVAPPADEEVLPSEAPAIQSAIRAARPIPEVITKAVEIAPVSPMASLPLTEANEPKPVRSLKRSERNLDLSTEAHSTHVAKHPAESTPSPLPAANKQKTVRSLRKSEQGPLPEIHSPPPDSKLPIHRHNDREVQEIRRQEALAMQSSGGHLLSRVAHPVMIIPGYLFALAGAVCFYFYELQIEITAGCVVAALLIAGFIFFKKPLSKHHAAFIAVISLFVTVFGALYYFPQLRYGT